MAELNTLDEEVFGKAYDARLMKRLLRYLGPYQWRVAVAVSVLILASATQDTRDSWLVADGVRRGSSTAGSSQYWLVHVLVGHGLR